VLRRPVESAQYTSVAFGLRCKEMGVRPSMGSVGDCYDKAMCESFFATLECELLDRRNIKTKAEARVACFEFIEGWYNLSRRHSASGYKSPINYERTAAQGLESLSPNRPRNRGNSTMKRLLGSRQSSQSAPMASTTSVNVLDRQ
jgi:Integrase core domain